MRDLSRRLCVTLCVYAAAAALDRTMRAPTRSMWRANPWRELCFAVGTKVIPVESKASIDPGVPAKRAAIQRLPHRYTVTATAHGDGDIRLEHERLPALVSAAPAEFGGPGDRWSPEELCVAAVADCFVLTFRALARAAKVPWSSLRCAAEGTLDRVDGVTRFVAFVVRPTLQVPVGTDEARARQLLERAEQTCLILQSLKASSHLEATVETQP